MSSEERPALHSHTFRLSYGETDPAGILYYGTWFRRMESVLSEFMYLEGLRQDELKDRFGWWMVTRATECEYLIAVGLFDEIRLELRVGEIRTSAFVFEFRMIRVADGVLVGRASVTDVTVSPDGHPVRIPVEFRERLEEWARR